MASLVGSADTSGGGGVKTVAAFVGKLYNMVDDEKVQHMIHWSGPSSFVVLNPEEFAKEILPQYFKHNNFASFVRQLNMYGFHKVNEFGNGAATTSAVGILGGSGGASSGAIGDQQNWEFSHPLFRRGKRELLSDIRRKMPSKGQLGRLGSNGGGGGSGGVPGAPDDLFAGGKDTKEVLQLLPLRILALEDKLKQSHEQIGSLWHESLALRQQLLHQQHITNHLSSFLAAAFGDDVEKLGPKRKRFRLEDLPPPPPIEPAELQGSGGHGGGAGSGSGAGNQHALLAAVAVASRDGDDDGENAGDAPDDVGALISTTMHTRRRGGGGDHKAA